MAFRLGIIGDEINPCVGNWLKWFDEQDPRPHGVEIRTANGKRVDELDRNEAWAIAQILNKHDIAVHGLASGFGKVFYADQNGQPNQDAIEAQLQMLERLIERAKIFGTNIIRGFALWRVQDLTVMWPRVIDFYNRALELVPRDIMIVIENEPATCCSTLGDVYRLWLALERNPGISALWDPGNYVYDPTLIHSFAESDLRAKPPFGLNDFLEETAPAYLAFVALVHAKNASLVPPAMEAQTVALDHGMIDFEPVIRLLSGIDECPIDLEPHRTETGQLDEKKRAMPGGEGYGNPEACTEDWKVLCDLTKGLA